MIRTKNTDKEEYSSELKPYVNNLDITLDFNLIDYLYEESLKVISVEENSEEDEENCTVYVIVNLH